MKWSPQQAAFIDWAHTGKGSCVLEAVAGAGKTTTLLAAARKMRGDIAIVAYNKKIAAEIKEKTQNDPHIHAGTVHSFGNRAYRRAFPHHTLERNKVRDLAEQRFPNLSDFHGPLVKLVSLAKQRALGVIGRLDDHIQWEDLIDHFDLVDSNKPEDFIASAIELLRLSNSVKEVIDFDDMIYLPLLLNLPFRRYDVVMVDEAQDTNPARRALVRAILKKGGRVIAVGDRHQAIYGFTGADNDSLDLIASDFDCVRLPLTVTYRCPKKIVAFAQQWVSHITAADTAPEGDVSVSSYDDFLNSARNNATLRTSAVLCRNNKPLVELAFRLIRNRIPCKVEGREIGDQIKKLALRWRVRSLDALRTKLDDYLSRETTKLLAKKKEDKIQQIEDMVETIKVIIDQCHAEKKNTLADLERYIDELFADDVKGMLVLSSIHKSKGREWETVYWLDRAGTCPSKWARQDWQKAQEVNLMYVAATRAQRSLIELYAPPKEDRLVTPSETAAAVTAVLNAPEKAPVAVPRDLASLPAEELAAMLSRGEITSQQKRNADKLRRARIRKGKRHET